jgi:integrase
MKLKYTLLNPQSDASALFVQFRRGGAPIKVYPSIVVSAADWDIRTNRLKEISPVNKEQNKTLDAWLSDLTTAITRIERNHGLLSRQSIELEMLEIAEEKRVEEKTNDFIVFFREYMDERRVTSQKGYITNLASTLRSVIACFGEHMHCGRVNYQALKRFKTFMYTATYPYRGKPRKYAINTIKKKVIILKTVMAEAVRSGLVPPFERSIPLEGEDSDTLHLSFHEVGKILKLELLSEKDKVIRDRFVFHCFCGMRVSDLNRVDKPLFSIREIKGKEAVVYVGRQKKTDNKVGFVLNKIASEIIKKYNFRFPKISDQKYNKRIKELAKRAGLTELTRKRTQRSNETEEEDIPKYMRISSHTARRSFCTNYYNIMKFPPSLIMLVSGHKSLREFLKYVKDVDIDPEEQMPFLDQEPDLG